jgi:hypothetical protein
VINADRMGTAKLSDGEDWREITEVIIRFISAKLGNLISLNLLERALPTKG